MKAVVQRVSKASVKVDGEITGSIGQGFLVLLGVAQGDDEADCDWLVDKILGLRIFEDQEGKMNDSLSTVQGELLVVSQFTLLGSVKKGKRPNFSAAAPPEEGRRLYEYFLKKAREQMKVETGVFGAHMDVELVNDGPVTILIDTKE